MATILIVHGAWGGGWEWTPVADELRELGHDVFVPTLTGMGERSHLGDDVALSAHRSGRGGPVPAGVGDGLVAAAEERGDGRVPYPPEVAPPEGLVPEAVRAAYVERTRPQPLATLTQPVRLDGPVSKLPRAYVRCVGDTDEDAGSMETFAELARAEGWLYRASATSHDLHLFDPRGTAAIIDDLAASFP